LETPKNIQSKASKSIDRKFVREESVKSTVPKERKGGKKMLKLLLVTSSSGLLLYSKEFYSFNKPVQYTTWRKIFKNSS
jgi:hypothetical protein